MFHLAYISLPVAVARTGFFPLNKQHFTVVTDDHHQLIFRVKQENDKAITTPLSNALLGEYFRNRLGLANGEYVTDIRLEFPKASPGFKMVENMSVYCQVLPNMPKDYRITNRADVGGRYGNEWESAKTSWNTSVWNIDAPTVKLPKTGY